MPAPLSVVIPTLNAEKTLPETLGSLFEGVAEGVLHQVILSDGGSDDQTVKIAKEAGCKVIEGQSGRGAQIAAGVRDLRTPWVLILHADTTLPQGWSALMEPCFETPLRAFYFKLNFRSQAWQARVVAWLANRRAHFFGLPYGDQGLLVHRDLLNAVGGYPESPLMEDVALARKLRGKLRALPDAIATGAERYDHAGWFAQAFSNLLRLMKYFLGTPPEVLARQYQRPPKT